MLKIQWWQKIKILFVRSTQTKGSGSNLNEKRMAGWRRRVIAGGVGKEKKEGG